MVTLLHRRRAFRSSGFNPATYGSNFVWWAARLHPVQADGSAVTSSLDYGNQGRHLVAASGSVTYAANALGGRPVFFGAAGGTTGLGTAVNVDAWAQPLTYAVIARRLAAGSTSDVLITGFNANDRIGWVNSGTQRFVSSSNVIGFLPGNPVNWMALVWVADGVNSFAYTSGVKTSMPTMGTAGTRANNAWGFRGGWFAEAVIWRSALSDAQASAACADLMATYGATNFA